MIYRAFKVAVLELQMDLFCACFELVSHFYLLPFISFHLQIKFINIILDVFVGIFSCITNIMKYNLKAPEYICMNVLSNFFMRNVVPVQMFLILNTELQSILLIDEEHEGCVAYCLNLCLYIVLFLSEC